MLASKYTSDVSGGRMMSMESTGAPTSAAPTERDPDTRPARPIVTIARSRRRRRQPVQHARRTIEEPDVAYHRPARAPASRPVS